MHKVDESIARELTSWKEIAGFLDVSVRTAQRYEVEMGLPVRRLTGEKGRAVAANVADLADWKRKHGATAGWWQNPEYWRWYAIASTCVLVILSLYVVRDLAARLRIGKPHDSHWVGATLVVTDASNREVWRKSFDREVRADVVQNRYTGDLDGDGSVEVLVPRVTHQADTTGGYLHCYSDTGVELWRIEPRVAVSDPTTRFSSIYVLRGYEVFPSPERDGTRWVLAAFAHHYDYPGVAVVVDSGGKQRGQYFSSGHTFAVHTMDLDGDGIEEMLLAGTDKDTNRAILRIFDPRKMSGAQVLTRGHPNQLVGFAPGTEKATVLFERSRLNRQGGRFNFAYWIGAGSNSTERSFQVNVAEQLDRTLGHVTYTIRADLSIASLAASDSLHQTYREQSLKDRGFAPFGPGDVEELQRGYTIRRH